MPKAKKVKNIGEYELYYLSKAVRPRINYVLAIVEESVLGRRQIKLWTSDHTGRKIAELTTKFEYSITKVLSKMGYEIDLH